MNKNLNNINTGALLNAFLNKKKITNTVMSRMIGRTDVSVIKYRENISIQTSILLEICHATKHNFFRDIADMLPNDFTVANKALPENAELLAQLQKENEVLKIQNELLMKLKG